MKYAATLLLFSLIARPGLAQEDTGVEKAAYCQYVRAQAEAERTLAAGFNAVGRFGQSDVSPSEKQAVVGVSKSISKHLQGAAAVDAGNLECELYAYTTDLQRVLKYQLAAIDQRIAGRRAHMIGEVLAILDDEIAQTQRRRRAGNATLADVFSLDQQRQQLYSQYRLAQQDAANPSIPPVRRLDPVSTLGKVEAVTATLQEVLNRKQRLQAWDVVLIVGMQKPVLGSTTASAPGAKPYASMSFTYNLNAHAYGGQLDEASRSLIALRREQNDELNKQVSVLLQTVAERMQLERSALQRLAADVKRIADESERIQAIDTAEAVRMRALLRVDLALAKMEQNLATDRLTLLAEAFDEGR
ncbi:hypothetical protein [Ralstonia sp. 1138]|uniref:hypothetical protein n=1 Tax=Ralstonia sp. 1138 TaxID=3156423 RepID=UPI00339962A1